MNEPSGPAVVASENRSPADAVPVASPGMSPALAPAAGRVPLLAWLIAAVFVAFELAVSGRYGFLQDELYFIEAGRHLAFGYVDQPPLAPLLTRVTDVLGVSPTAVRIVPALAGGAVVIMAAKFAALFGAGRFGRVLAALTTACAPLVLALAHFGITEPLDLLAWTVVLYCVLVALLRDRPRWWVWRGRQRRPRARSQQRDAPAADRPRGRPAVLCAASRRPAHAVAVARRGHRRGDLVAEPDLAGHTRVAPGGDGGRRARREQRPGRLRQRDPGPTGVRGPAGDPGADRGLRVALAERGASVHRDRGHAHDLYVAVWVPGKSYYCEGTVALLLRRGPPRPSAGWPGAGGPGCGWD